MLRQMQQSPEEFDSSKLKINIEFPKPRNITVGMSFNFKNQQQLLDELLEEVATITGTLKNKVAEPAPTTQEKFQKIEV